MHIIQKPRMISVNGRLHSVEVAEMINETRWLRRKKAKDIIRVKYPFPDRRLVERAINGRAGVVLPARTLQFMLHLIDKLAEDTQ